MTKRTYYHHSAHCIKCTAPHLIQRATAAPVKLVKLVKLVNSQTLNKAHRTTSDPESSSSIG
jgi:hypothetical protein